LKRESEENNWKMEKMQNNKNKVKLRDKAIYFNKKKPVIIFTSFYFKNPQEDLVVIIS